MHIPKGYKLTTSQREKLLIAKKTLLASPSDQFYFKEFQVDISSPESLVEDLLKHLPDNNNISEIVKYYNSLKLPIYSLKYYFGKDYLTTYKYVIGDDSFKVWSSLGRIEEYESNDEAAESCKDLVIDLISLLTLNELNLLDKLNQIFNLYIHQKTLDELREIKGVYTDFSEKGSMTIYANGKNIGITEIDKSHYKKELDIHVKLINYITNNLSVVGKKSGSADIFDGKTYTALASTFGPPTLASIQLCSTNNYTLLSDEITTRQLASSFKVKSFDTITLLNKLYTSREIDNVVLHDNVINLLLFNFYFLRINSSTLTHAIKKRYFMKFKKSLAPFIFLSNKEVSVESLTKISLAFLNDLWLDDTIEHSFKIKWNKVMFDKIRISKTQSQVKSIKNYIIRSTFSPQLRIYLRSHSV